MSTPVFLVLGGYGNTGLTIARLLLQETSAQVTVAGRHLERAGQAARRLNQEFPGERASACAVDASDPESLRRAVASASFVISAASTARYASLVARAALDAGIDYLDIHYSSAKTAALQALAPEIERAGRCFITDAGFHPGLPAALVRYGALEFDSLESATVGSVINQEGGIPLTDSLYELLEEFRDWQAIYYRDGEWRKAGWSSSAGMPRIDFGMGFGARSCYPMALEEMRRLPALFPGLRDAGFYVAGWNWFADLIVMPLLFVSMRVAPRISLKPMGRLLAWSLRTFSRPPWGVITKAELAGTLAGAPHRVEVTMFHKDGYAFTAIPVVACLLQYLEGSARKPGLWLMGQLADPARLVHDMRRMGIIVC